MLNESHDDFSAWKNKLEAFDRLPGEPVNKDVAWTKLHARLREKRKVKKTAWYWVAAACFILVFLLTWLIKGNQDITLVKKVLQSKPKNLSVTPAQSTDRFIEISSMKPVEKKQLVTSQKSLKKENLPTSHVAIRDPVRIETAVINNAVPIYTSLTKPDTVVLVSAIPAKKKLRVVHINELSKPIDEPAQIVRNNAIPVYQNEPFSGAILPRFAGSRNASDNILKIKLSPSN